MCLDIPLVDSGSMGFNGQATLILKPLTKCYDCRNPPVQQKQYPVCTIRRQPSQPIHCVIWSKLLFQVLFTQQQNELSDLKLKYQSLLFSETHSNLTIIPFINELYPLSDQHLQLLQKQTTDSIDYSKDNSEHQKSSINSYEQLLLILYWCLFNLFD